LNDTREKNWLAAQASNLEPPRSERGAPPICASGQWLRAEELNLESRLQRPAACH
jgi:hypothetical protein